MPDKEYEVTVVWNDGVREKFRSSGQPTVDFGKGVLTLLSSTEGTTLVLAGVRYVSVREIQ